MKLSNNINFSLFTIGVLALCSCSAGDIRLFNDALSSQSGNEVTYPDQSDYSYIGDIKWTTGVRNGSGFQIIRNTGTDYCKVRVTFEDKSYETYRMDPSESTGRLYVSIYNQEDEIRTLCNSTDEVFRDSFK